jgi:hypothetical protein
MNFVLTGKDVFVATPDHIRIKIILDYALVGPCHGVALQMRSGANVGSYHGMTMQFYNSFSHATNRLSIFFIILRLSF